MTGRVREGLPHRERARDSDPLALGFSNLVLNSYLTLGMWDRFDAEYKRGLDLEGEHAFAKVRGSCGSWRHMQIQLRLTCSSTVSRKFRTNCLLCSHCRRRTLRGIKPWLFYGSIKTSRRCSSGYSPCMPEPTGMTS